MRSLLIAKTAKLLSEPNGALFVVKQYDEPAIFGIKLSDAINQDDSSLRVLLLNHEYARQGQPKWHWITLWHGSEIVISFGSDWFIAPDFDLDALTGPGQPNEMSAVSIGVGGIYFRASVDDRNRLGNRVHLNVETLEPENDVGNSAVHLKGYRLYLSKDDAEHGRPPIFQHGIEA
jgi:hypothetical protein